MVYPPNRVFNTIYHIPFTMSYDLGFSFRMSGDLCFHVLQVWDVKFTTSKSRDSSPNEAQEFTTIAVARLILIVGRPAPIRLPKVLEDLLALSSRRKAESVSHVPKL